MRKPIAALLMLSFMAFWIWAAGTVGTVIAGNSVWLQLLYYIVAGFGWILPLRPLLKWMNANEAPEED